ncbi:MAG: flippase-like domain-containing protein [Intrasporangiaceae bacterium]|nr:flippase-like domain-containing protein [Intrasporangiaceae bacterium]
MSKPTEPAGLPRPTVGSVLRLLAGVGGAALLLGWVLPTVTKTSWGEILTVLGGVPAPALWGCFALTLAFLSSYAVVLRASLPGLSIPRALVVNTAGTAISKLFPGGGAVGLAATFLICRTWGFPLRAISTSAVVTLVWNMLTRAALPVLAIGLLAMSDLYLPGVLRQAAWGAAVTGVIMLALFVGIIASARVADRVGRAADTVLGRWLKRPGRARAAMTDTRTQIIERVQKAWHWLTLGMIAFFVAQLGIFLIALDVTGVTMAFAATFAAFAIGRLLTAVGITPGGIGITETGTAAALVAFGANAAEAGAAVVLMSIFTNLIELPLGVLAWIYWTLDRRRNGPIPIEHATAGKVTSHDLAADGHHGSPSSSPPRGEAADDTAEPPHTSPRE